jgi:uncharacterized protein involved in type VI secretion and phage assembly
MIDTQIQTQKYYGKYRGTVLQNIDPLLMGRIQVVVPDVSNIIPSSWAMPCVPVAGLQMGMYAIPPIGAGVWIEFEQGDPDYPIWVGCWWGSGAEVPTLANATPALVSHMVMQTTLQNSLLISDAPGPLGGIILKTTTGAMIMINDVGITISNGKGASIVMVGPTVTINNGALTII